MSSLELNAIERLGYKLKKPDERILNLMENMDVSKLVKTVLANRLTYEDLIKYDVGIEAYLYNNLNFNKDIDKLKDVYLAAEIIIKHINNNSHIAIVSDYDADGVNAATILYLIFKNIFMVDTKKLTVLVNKRKNGNGYNNVLMERIIEVDNKHKIDMIISADHGSTNNKEYKILKERDIDLVITDHHQIKYNNYPDYADAFINTQRKDSDYFKDVSGCFVAFITCIAAYKKMFKTDNLSAFNPIIPFVGLTTITDVMSLKLPINRDIVKTAVNEMNSGRNPLWLIIKNLLGIPGKIITKHFGYNIGPLINTANRLDIEDSAFHLLTADTNVDVFSRGRLLLQNNAFRKKIQQMYIREAKLHEDILKYKHSVVHVIESEASISGIVAADLGNSFKLPAICFLDNPNSDVLVGSCRGIIKGLNILNILINIDNIDNDIFAKKDGNSLFGGHEQAAGCSVKKDKIEKFKELFDTECSKYQQHIADHKFLSIDMVLPDIKISPSLIKELEALAPYGKDWEEVCFFSTLTIKKIIKISTFVKIIFGTKNNREIQAKCFFKSSASLNMEEFISTFNRGDLVYVAYNINLDAYANNMNFVLDVQDIKKCEDYK